MKFRVAQKKVLDMFDNQEFIENIKDEDSTMIKHLSILKQINQHGYLTTSSQAGRKTSTIYEKAFITGFMLKNDAIQFIKRINIETDKNAIYVSINNKEFDKKLTIPLTIQKEKEWKVITHWSPTIPLRVWNQERKKINLDKDNIVYIFCWDPKWNRNASSRCGLFTDVLKLLKS
jgi:hypothetical protein